MPPAPDARAPADIPRDGTYDFSIAVIDLHTLASTAEIRRDATQTTVVALAEQGYMAMSPVFPTLAICFNTLELFRRIRARKASMSVEAFAKVICDYYAIPYRRRYRTAMSDAYDVYLTMLRSIDARISTSLKRDTPDWRVQNLCPACCYVLEDEPPLVWGHMYCIDGNNSLKRIAKFGHREVADTRDFDESDYYLPAAWVDQFKDEVRSHRSREARQQATEERAEDDDEWSDVEEDDVEFLEDPTDDFRQCTKNWKSAARDKKKKMWGIFNETGIFATASKYALAIIARALRLLGPRQLIGYDIGCSFLSTVNESSLGPDFKWLGCQCCVNAFHGYSHSHRCQTQHHPSVILGAGLEEFEGMERVFSDSNDNVLVTRYASKYHRKVIITQHFRRWDDDKYANLATMLLNNIRQASDIIAENTALVDKVCLSLGCGPADLTKWQAKEAEYFATLGMEDPANIAAVEYVGLLQVLDAAETGVAKAMNSFMTSLPENYAEMPSIAGSSQAATSSYYAELSRTRKQETERRLLHEKRDTALREVIMTEVKLGITVRWRPDMPQYIETQKYVVERDYRVALDNLHRLVIQRLFELHNLNVSQTAYKVRTYIAKSLQRRLQAIRTAVAKYNNAALRLTPPRPTLDWSKVTHYTFIEDLGSHHRCKPWAQPLVRETMKKARKILCAREELERCNVEVRRLHTAVLDEIAELQGAIRAAQEHADPILGPLEDFAVRHTRVNSHLLAVIQQIHVLKGFSGERTPGRRIALVRDAQDELVREEEDTGIDESEMQDTV
ncbi:hypothetical protein BV20DRAFT_1035216 [Pilatotrama ljubarskyi]|nr:hypothetical protein BV20DRAFT_1035216 [Pilatotrama ljubarskyi]